MLCSIVLLAVACQTESTETYSVVFRVDGSVHARVAIDDDFTLPADPEKDNYTFGGWFLDTDFTKPFSQGALSSQTFTADLDVYAKMLPKSGANSSQSNNNTGNNSGNNNGDNSGGSGGNGSGGSGNWQQGDSSFSVSQADQMATYNDIEDYLDDWLSENAQEKGAFRSQMGGLRIDLDAKKSAWQFLNSRYESVYPSIDVKWVGGETGTYKITFVWSDSDTTITKEFTKNTKEAAYAGWSGNNSRVDDEWLSEDEPMDVVDMFVAAGINTINKVTGNIVTGKFGADGILGISILGKTYGLRVKGNFDGTATGKLNNEIGISIVDADGKDIGGVYYKAEEEVKDNKLYFRYAVKGDDGNLLRDNSGNYTYAYKYIDYANVYGFLKFLELIPDSYEDANDGVLAFEKHGRKVNVDGLETFLSLVAPHFDPSIIDMAVDMVAKAYEHDGRYYIDINLGSVLKTVTGLLGQFDIDLTDYGIDLKALNIDLSNITGLIGHITLSGEVKNNELTDIEFAVNIAESKIYLNSARGEGENSFTLPAMSFAIYLEDFSFLTDEAVEDVIPDGVADAEYFSPTNIAFEGDVYIDHIERDEQGQVVESKTIDKTFHVAFVTDFNLFEFIENGANSTAKAALVIRASDGKNYDPANSHNFLSLSYEQKDRILCASGSVFDLGDSNQLYTFDMKDKSAEQIKTELMLWLGLDTANGNWHGVSSSFELLDYVLTSDTTFKANKTYYVVENGAYIEANVEVGAAVTANTYYVVPDTYESAKAIFGNGFIRALLAMILGSSNNGTAMSSSAEVAEANDTNFYLADIFESFKEIYDEFVDAGKIAVALDGEDLAIKVDVTAAMINNLITTINYTFKTEIPAIINPKEFKFFLNYGDEYKDKCYISVEVGDKKYELTFDNSASDTFGIDFKLALISRIHRFHFSATKIADQSAEAHGFTRYNITASYDICERNNQTPKRHTSLTLTEFYITWGADTNSIFAIILPSAEAKAAALPIFPSEDIPSVGTKVAEGILKLISNEKIQPYLLLGAGFAMQLFVND